MWSGAGVVGAEVMTLWCRTNTFIIIIIITTIKTDVCSGLVMLCVWSGSGVVGADWNLVF